MGLLVILQLRRTIIVSMPCHFLKASNWSLNQEQTYLTIATFIDSIIFVANVESMPKLISFWIDEKSEDCIFGHFIGGTGGKGGGTVLPEVNKRLNPVSLAIAHCSIP